MLPKKPQWNYSQVLSRNLGGWHQEHYFFHGKNRRDLQVAASFDYTPPKKPCSQCHLNEKTSLPNPSHSLCMKPRMQNYPTTVSRRPFTAGCLYFAAYQFWAHLASTERATLRIFLPLKGFDMHSTTMAFATSADSVGPSRITSSWTYFVISKNQMYKLWSIMKSNIKWMTILEWNLTKSGHRNHKGQNSLHK